MMELTDLEIDSVLHIGLHRMLDHKVIERLVGLLVIVVVVVVV